MSSALAIAGVTEVLRNLLDNGLIDRGATGTLGVRIAVSVGPPDRVMTTNGNTEPTQLNLFMYQVTPNAGWRNEGLPSRDGSGRQRLSNPPLALNLHYLISAHASEALHGDILLGYAMQFLHETPVLTRGAIQRALIPSPPIGGGMELTSTMRALADSGLENQIEQIKITPEYLNTEELSKLWTATQSHLRPTAAYMASVVLIQAEEPVRAPLPVLSRGLVDADTHRERGIAVELGLIPPVPVLETLIPVAKQPVAQIGAEVELQGYHLNADVAANRTVLLSNDRFSVHAEILVPNDSATSVRFSIPADRADEFPVGVYSVSVRLRSPGEAHERETNRLAMTLAPRITRLSPEVTRGSSGTASFTLNFLPALHEGQKAVLILGQQEFQPEPHTFTPLSPATTSLDFVINDAPVTPAPGLLARLRIDGIESPIIDRAAVPPVFFNQRVIIT